MRKWIVIVLSIFLCSGCANTGDELPGRMEAYLQSFASQDVVLGSNMNKYYYSYYLPLDMGRRESNALSEVFSKHGYRVVMNFDPSAIVIEEFYKETKTTNEESSIEDKSIKATYVEAESKWIYSGYYKNINGVTYPFSLQMIDHQSHVLLYLDGEVVKFYTYIPRAEVMSFMKSMMKITTSISYDKELVINDYSLKQLADVKKQNIDFIDQHLPSSGSLADLLNDENK